MNLHRLLFHAACLTLCAAPSSAQVPNLVSYQGRVSVGTTNFNGTGQFKFALVNTSGATTYWSNNGSSTAGSQPTAAVSLTVTRGLYSVLLGDTALTNMAAIPASVWTNADVRLRIWFNDGTTGFQLLTPDQRLTPNGYLPDGAVGTAKMSDSAVTAAKIAPGAVGSTQIATGAVLGGNIASGAVGNSHLANATINLNPGTGLSGGGPVSLGGTISLNNSGVLSLTGGGGITVNASSGALTLGSTATNLNTASAIVRRDASGNFSAGTISGIFSGNGAALTNLNATNITSGTLTLPANGLIVGGTQLVLGGGNAGIGTDSPTAGLHLSSAGGENRPQAWINQSSTADYSRLRMTVGGSYAGRWDIAVRDDAFVIYSGLYNKELLRLDDKGLKAAGGLVIESRTDDPPPETGRIWLRTDQ